MVLTHNIPGTIVSEEKKQWKEQDVSGTHNSANLFILIITIPVTLAKHCHMSTKCGMLPG
jgi:hypothetical protein